MMADKRDFLGSQQAKYPFATTGSGAFVQILMPRSGLAFAPCSPLPVSRRIRSVPAFTNQRDDGGSRLEHGTTIEERGFLPPDSSASLWSWPKDGSSARSRPHSEGWPPVPYLTRCHSILISVPSGLRNCSVMRSPSTTSRKSSRVRTLPTQFGNVDPSTRLPLNSPFSSTV